MKIFKLLMISALICISFSGCFIPDKANKGNRNVPPDETGVTNINGHIDIHKAIAEDKEFDGKSIIWDGKTAKIVNDELDIRDVMDGRYGEFELVTLETGLGFDLFIQNTGQNSDLFMSDKYPPSDNADEYSIETPGRFLSIKKESPGTFDRKTSELSSDKDLTESDSDVIKSETEHRLFTGIIKTDSGEDMIGFLLLIPAEDAVYSFKYAGIGNYSDIRAEAIDTMTRLLNQF